MIVDPCSGEIRDREMDRGRSILELLSDDLERATDDYVEALDGEAEAENRFKREWAESFLRDDGPATMRHKQAEAKNVGLLNEWTTATARVKACKAKVEELTARMVAAQSVMKFTGMQDGGSR